MIYLNKNYAINQTMISANFNWYINKPAHLISGTPASD
ncbi:hypothetical protein SALWKB2_0747 [Snodgrassella alvi wkB2]|nr:hypothetical protein SALWKB2_0747 [Snodgrassella alvi wkB2]